LDDDAWVGAAAVTLGCKRYSLEKVPPAGREQGERPNLIYDANDEALLLYLVGLDGLIILEDLAWSCVSRLGAKMDC
jgi:hypothetical protein